MSIKSRNKPIEQTVNLNGNFHEKTTGRGAGRAKYGGTLSSREELG